MGAVVGGLLCVRCVIVGTVVVLVGEPSGSSASRAMAGIGPKA
jgi:hypothetical protein